MTRFIVEEGGKRRAFKASEGVITIGSGEKAMLKLASPGVAEVHAELEMKDGVVRLRLKPGVVPPQVGGKPAESEQLLAPGTVLKLWSEDAFNFALQSVADLSSAKVDLRYVNPNSSVASLICFLYVSTFPPASSISSPL